MTASTPTPEEIRRYWPADRLAWPMTVQQFEVLVWSALWTWSTYWRMRP